MFILKLFFFLPLMAKLIFQQPLLQSSVSHDVDLVLKKCPIIFTVKNEWAA